MSKLNSKKTWIPKKLPLFVDLNKGNPSNVNDEALTGDEEMFTWYEVDLDKEMEKQDELVDLEWEGYVADKVWQVIYVSFTTMNDLIITV